MWKKFWTIIEKPFLLASSLCSIISIVAICVQTKAGLIVSICALCVSLVIILVAIVRVLNRFLEQTPSKHNCVSSFVRYKTNDGENIEFESYKLIQVKCSIMQFFDIGFKWSGNRFPKIYSDLQDVEYASEAKEKTAYDSAKLRLKKPALYNETTVIHFKTLTSDPERCSEPKVELCVKMPIEFIHVDIQLGYKDSSYSRPATVERARIDAAVPQKYEVLESIPFDGKYKQYTYSFINPEPGYFYKITWKR